MFSEFQEDYIKRNYNKKTVSQIAKDINSSPNKVRNYCLRNRLHLTKKKYNPNEPTFDTELIIVTSLMDGYSYEEISDMLDRPFKQIYKIVLKSKISGRYDAIAKSWRNDK